MAYVISVLLDVRAGYAGNLVSLRDIAWRGDGKLINDDIYDEENKELREQFCCADEEVKPIDFCDHICEGCEYFEKQVGRPYYHDNRG